MSLGVERYMQASLADSTRASYATTWRCFGDFCELRGWPREGRLTVHAAREFLCALAESGSIKTSTLHAYSSALHTLHELRMRPDDKDDNPLSHPTIKRLLTGIGKCKARSEAAARARQRVLQPLTADIVRQLAAVHDFTRPRDAMLYAALSLGVGALLRLSEMLGNQHDPDRALRAEQFKWAFDDGKTAPPTAVTLTLKVNKTDQRRMGRAKEIASQLVLVPLWRWWRMRGVTGCRRLFFGDGKRLSSNALVGTCAASSSALASTPPTST